MWSCTLLLLIAALCLGTDGRIFIPRWVWRFFESDIWADPHQITFELDGAPGGGVDTCSAPGRQTLLNNSVFLIEGEYSRLDIGRFTTLTKLDIQFKDDKGRVGGSYAVNTNEEFPAAFPNGDTELRLATNCIVIVDMTYCSTIITAVWQTTISYVMIRNIEGQLAVCTRLHEELLPRSTGFMVTGCPPGQDDGDCSVPAGTNSGLLKKCQDECFQTNDIIDRCPSDRKFRFIRCCIHDCVVFQSQGGVLPSLGAAELCGLGDYLNTIWDNPCNECSWATGEVHFPSPYSCCDYAECIEGTANFEIKSCPHGLFWNQAEWRCGHPEETRCPIDPCGSVMMPPQGRYRYKMHCGAYFQCDDGITIGAECCPQSTTFDAVSQKCITSKQCDQPCPFDSTFPAEPFVRVRLVNPFATTQQQNPSQGRIEVYYDQLWGTVCDSGFGPGPEEASAVCRTLGFGSGTPFAGGFFGVGTGPIWLTDLDCPAGATHILACTHPGWGSTGRCTHNDDAGVICSGALPDRCPILPSSLVLTVVPSVGTSPIDASVQELRFQCEASVALPAVHVYVITWYIDGELVHTTGELSANDVATSSFLHEYHWAGSDTHGLNMWVHCSIVAKPCPNGVVTSQRFFAGLQVLNNQLRVDEANCTQAHFQLTVPVPCPTNVRTCSVTFAVTAANCDIYPDPQKRQAMVTATCPEHFEINPDFKAIITSDFSVSNINWEAVSDVCVCAAYDQIIQNTAHKLFVGGLRHLPDTARFDVLANARQQLDVFVNDVANQLDGEFDGSVCKSCNDPHMWTFDQRRYEHHTPGEYILYRNSKKCHSVHMFYDYCGHIWSTISPTCNCAIAIQAGKHVFILDKCHNNAGTTIVTSLAFKNSIQANNCPTDPLTVNYPTTANGDYEVIFPNSGTRVVFNQWMTTNCVRVYPSACDVGESEGLCGQFNGNTIDDYFYLTGGVPMFANPPGIDCAPWDLTRECPDTFSAAWMIGLPDTAPSLFVNNPQLVCNCPTTLMAFGCPDPGFTDRCMFNGPSGADIGGAVADDIVDPKKLAKFKDPKEPGITREPGYADPWTEECACNYCEEYIMWSDVYKHCEETGVLDDDVVNEAIDMCKLDIYLTGGLFYVEAALDLLARSCRDRARLNPRFWQNNQLRWLSDTICPNDCFARTGNGICINGICVCGPDWVGRDCCIPVLISIKIAGIAAKGLCDMKKRPCKFAHLFSDTVTTSTLCCSEEFMVDGRGRLESTGRKHYSAAIYRRDGEVLCEVTGRDAIYDCFPQAPQIAIVFQVSIRNLGEYGKPALFVPYHSSCMTCKIRKRKARCTRKDPPCTDRVLGPPCPPDDDPCGFFCPLNPELQTCHVGNKTENRNMDDCRCDEMKRFLKKINPEEEETVCEHENQICTLNSKRRCKTKFGTETRKGTTYTVGVRCECVNV